MEEKKYILLGYKKWHKLKKDIGAYDCKFSIYLHENKMTWYVFRDNRYLIDNSYNYSGIDERSPTFNSSHYLSTCKSGHFGLYTVHKAKSTVSQNELSSYSVKTYKMAFDIKKIVENYYGDLIGGCILPFEYHFTKKEFEEILSCLLLKTIEIQDAKMEIFQDKLFCLDKFFGEKNELEFKAEIKKINGATKIEVELINHEKNRKFIFQKELSQEEIKIATMILDDTIPKNGLKSGVEKDGH